MISSELELLFAFDLWMAQLACKLGAPPSFVVKLDLPGFSQFLFFFFVFQKS